MTKNNEISSKPSRVKIIAYWFFTGLISLQIATGAVLDLSRNQSFKDILTHLGYPFYLFTILGICRIFAFFTILLPKFPLLKEWAYAGVFFEFIIGTSSHIAVGDSPAQWVWPLAFALFTIASWALRPPSRRFPANIAI